MLKKQPLYYDHKSLGIENDLTSAKVMIMGGNGSPVRDENPLQFKL